MKMLLVQSFNLKDFMYFNFRLKSNCANIYHQDVSITLLWIPFGKIGLNSYGSNNGADG